MFRKSYHTCSYFFMYFTVFYNLYYMKHVGLSTRLVYRLRVCFKKKTFTQCIVDGPVPLADAAVGNTQSYLYYCCFFFLFLHKSVVLEKDNLSRNILITSFIIPYGMMRSSHTYAYINSPPYVQVTST